MHTSDPPHRNNYKNLAFTASLLIAALTAVASLGGLLNPEVYYPTPDLREFALANDVANLLIGLPVLLFSLWLVHRDKYVGRLLWPGAILYTLYNYLAYAVALPVSWLYLAYLLIVTLCFYTLILTFSSIDMNDARQRLGGRVPERFAGLVLLILGSFVLVRVIVVIVQAQISAGSVEYTERALLLADSLLAPAWIIGGLLLWRKRPPGYGAGLALLFQGSMLFLGLIFVLALQPIITSAALPWVDILVVSLMGLICFIPFFLYLRGALTDSP
jgi:hypothetical protein